MAGFCPASNRFVKCGELHISATNRCFNEPDESGGWKATADDAANADASLHIPTVKYPSKILSAKLAISSTKFLLVFSGFQSAVAMLNGSVNVIDGAHAVRVL